MYYDNDDISSQTAANKRASKWVDSHEVDSGSEALNIRVSGYLGGQVAESLAKLQGIDQDVKNGVSLIIPKLADWVLSPLGTRNDLERTVDKAIQKAEELETEKPGTVALVQSVFETLHNSTGFDFSKEHMNDSFKTTRSRERLQLTVVVDSHKKAFGITARDYIVAGLKTLSDTLVDSPDDEKKIIDEVARVMSIAHISDDDQGVRAVMNEMEKVMDIRFLKQTPDKQHKVNADREKVNKDSNQIG